MKLIKNIYLTALISLCICSCTEKEFVDDTSDSSKGVAVSLRVSGTDRSITRAVGGTAVSKESTIGNVYLLFYEADGDMFDEPKAFIKRDHLENVEGAWAENIELSGLFQAQEYDVYAFANLPESSSENLSESSIRGAVLELTETLGAARNEQGSGISFSAVSSYTGGQKKLSVDVKRTVARIESKIDMSRLDDNWTIESVNVLNERDMISYQEGAEPAGVSRISSYDAFLVGSDSLYYYTYENPASTQEDDILKLRINLHKNGDNTAKRTYTALVAKKYNGELKRNTIYRSKIILSETPTPVVVESTPMAWSDTIDTNVDIPSVYLDFPTDIISLARVETRYNFKSDADSVYIEVDMPNMFIEPVGNSGYIFPVGMDVYELKMNLSTYGKPEERGKITFNAGNLTKVLEIVKPETDVTFRYAVSPCDDWLPNEIKEYNSLIDADAKFNFTFSGIAGLQAWYGIRMIQQILPNGIVMDRPTPPLPRTYDESGIFDTNAEFPVMNAIGSFSNRDNGTILVYMMECGTSNISMGPIMKKFKFAIKINK